MEEPDRDRLIEVLSEFGERFLEETGGDFEAEDLALSTVRALERAGYRIVAGT